MKNLRKNNPTTKRQKIIGDDRIEIIGCYDTGKEPWILSIITHGKNKKTDLE